MTSSNLNSSNKFIVSRARFSFVIFVAGTNTRRHHGRDSSREMAVLERRLRDCRKTSFFLQYASNNTSQGGEDGIIAEIFRRIGYHDKISQPYCVEIGSWVRSYFDLCSSITHPILLD
jgi:chorismate mutase